MGTMQVQTRAKGVTCALVAGLWSLKLLSRMQTGGDPKKVTFSSLKTKKTTQEIN